MMHNSLLIADRLKETNANSLHRRRRDPHRTIRRLPIPEKADPGYLALVGSWNVIGSDGDEGAWAAAEDFTAFLKQIGVGMNPDGRHAGSIVFILDESAPVNAFLLKVDTDRVEVRAADNSGIWAGLVYLEREISGRGEAVLRLGASTHRPSWKTQISQAPFGSNYLVPDLTEEYLSDDAFRLLAHYGINGMTIYGDWLCYVQSERYPEINPGGYARNIQILKDTAKRAMKYGIRLYYVPVSPKFTGDHPLFQRFPEMKGSRIVPGQSGKAIHNLCSSNEDTMSLIRETMGRLFEEVPGLGGLILIIGGESYYHCYMRPDRNGLPEGVTTNCPRCAGRRPEEVVNDLLKATAEAVHRVKPEAPVMAWPYSAFLWSSDPAQLELVRTMPNDVSLLTTIDKDEVVEKDGYSKHIWDYSIDYQGPAGNLLKQAEILAERDMQLYIKTETALGLECIQFPYAPCLHRLGDKWRVTASQNPSGVLQSWMFFGMWGSRAEELGWWTSWQPERPLDEVLQVMAARDFGDHDGAVLRVWELMSKAVSHLPYIPIYFRGPEFIGPAHPLYFEEKPAISENFYAQLYFLQEYEETFSDTVATAAHLMVHEQIPFEFLQRVMRLQNEESIMETVEREYGKAVAYTEEAWQLIRGLSVPADAVHAEILTEEALLVESIYRTFLSTLHTYRFLDAKRSFLDSGEQRFMKKMVDIAERELENTRKALPLVQAAPWLDLGLRVDGNFPSSKVMMEEKIRLLESELGKRGVGYAG